MSVKPPQIVSRQNQAGGPLVFTIFVESCQGQRVHPNGLVMTIPERIKSFLRERIDVPHCDDCIAKKLRLRSRQQSQHVSVEIAGSENFLRRRGRCSECGNERLVIRFSVQRPFAELGSIARRQTQC